MKCISICQKLEARFKNFQLERKSEGTNGEYLWRTTEDTLATLCLQKLLYHAFYA